MAMNMEFKQLDWDYKHYVEYGREVWAIHYFKLPEWVNEERICKLKVYEYDSMCYGNCFTATLWWFNRGVQLVRASDMVKSLTDCQILAEQRLHEIFGIFLNKDQ
jgi:hypothetical protein